MEGTASARGTARPWSNSEHRRFLEALEVHGRGSSGMEWELMADYVGPSRTAEEVREHAYKYFLKLQSESNAEDREVVAGGERALDDGTWTLEQDVAFENALAMFDEDTEYRWDRVAEMVPGQSTEAVRTRYKLLLLDVARIEGGDAVTLRYRVPASSSSGLARKRKRELKINVLAPPGHSTVAPASETPDLAAVAAAGVGVPSELPDSKRSREETPALLDAEEGGIPLLSP